MHRRIVSEHLFSAPASGQDVVEGTHDVADGEGVGKEFFNHRFVSYEIDERDVSALDDMIESPAVDAWQDGLVAYDLRHAEQGGLERGGAACHYGCRGMVEKGVGLTLDISHRCACEIFLIEREVYRRGTSYDKLAPGEVSRRLKHSRQIVGNLMTAAAGKEGDDGFGGVETVADTEVGERDVIARLEGTDFFCRRVAYVMHRIVVAVFEEGLFKRQDAQHLLYITLEILDAPLFPCPYLGRNIIECMWERGSVSLAVGCQERADIQVEAGIIDGYDGIGLPPHDVTLAEREVPEDGAEVCDDGQEAHECRVAIVAHHLAALCLHLVTAEETELRLRVEDTQRTHETRGMKVA